VSGVESRPGKKDPERVLAFIRSAREAAEEMHPVGSTAKVGVPQPPDFR
jgi:hypothetical protein